MVYVSECAQKLMLYVDSSILASPSANLMRSLLSLSTSIQRLGTSRDPSRLGHVANGTLRFFVTELLKEAEGEAIEWRLHEQQALWLSFESLRTCGLAAGLKSLAFLMRKWLSYEERSASLSKFLLHTDENFVFSFALKI